MAEDQPRAGDGLRNRPIRSFVRRAGRMGPGQQRALDELGQRFVLPFATQPLDFAATFGRRAPTVLEIGFGMGDATATVAAAQPGTDFIGSEVHQPGVGALLKRLGFHLWHPALELRDPAGQWLLLRGLEEFREHLGGDLTITLLRAIGIGEEVHQMDVAEILRALAWLRRQEHGA